jgi:hypothetical protein
VYAIAIASPTSFSPSIHQLADDDDDDADDGNDDYGLQSLTNLMLNLIYQVS